jgi:hypothetical protein
MEPPNARRRVIIMVVRRVRPDDAYMRELVLAGLEDLEIARVAELDGLVPVTLPELSRIRSGLVDAPTRLDLGDRDVKAWLMRKGVSDLYQGGGVARETVELLRDRVRRHVVEALVLGGHKAESVAKFLQKHKLREADDFVIEGFKAWFWSIDAFEFPELLAFLERHECLGLYEVALQGPEKAEAVATGLLERTPQPPKGTTRPAMTEAIYGRMLEELSKRGVDAEQFGGSLDPLPGPTP